MIATAVRAREAVLVDSCPTNGSGMATSRCDAPASRTESGGGLPDAHLPAEDATCAVYGVPSGQRRRWKSSRL